MSDNETLELQKELQKLQEEIQLEYILGEPITFEKNYLNGKNQSNQNSSSTNCKTAGPSKQNKITMNVERGDPLFDWNNRTGKERNGKFNYTFYLSTGKEIKKVMRPRMVPTQVIYGCSVCPRTKFFFHYGANEHFNRCTKKGAALSRIPLKKVVRHEKDGTEIVIVENINILNVQEEPLVKMGDLSNNIDVSPIKNYHLKGENQSNQNSSSTNCRTAGPSNQSKLSMNVERGDPLFAGKHRTRKGKIDKFTYTFYLSTGKEVKRVMRPRMVPTQVIYACSVCPKTKFFFHYGANEHFSRCTKKGAALSRIPLRKVVRHEKDGTEIVIAENLNILNVQEPLVEMGDLSNNIDVSPIKNFALDIKEEIDYSLVKMEQECINNDLEKMKGLVKMEQENI